MRTDGLAFDQIPSLATPLGFFVAAPLFGMLACTLLLWQPELLGQRWLGAPLAATHLFTLGFAAQVMLGALYQVMPVLAGQPLGGPRLARLIQLLLSGGTLALAWGFVGQTVAAFGVALLALPLALALFLASWGKALTRTRPAGPTARVLRLAALSLLLAAALGLYQALYHLLPASLSYRPGLTDAHLLWGGFGWVLLLVIGVSLQVIPMFHVTPPLPGWIATRLAPLLLAALLLATLLPTSRAGALLLGALLLLYAGAALRCLAARQRKRLDYTVRCWQLALAHLLLVGLGLLGLGGGLPLGTLALPLGVAFGIGFMLSVITGMLQKIVPFLLYLHLQRACLSDPLAMMALPNMQELLPTAAQRLQWRLHLALLGGLYLSCIPALAPLLGSVAGVIGIANFAWLGGWQWRALRRYRSALPA